MTVEFCLGLMKMELNPRDNDYMVVGHQTGTFIAAVYLDAITLLVYPPRKQKHSEN